MTRLRNRGSWWPVLKQVTKLLYFELAPIQWKSLICLQGNCFHCWPFLLHWNAHEWYSLSILVSCTVTFLHATAVIFLLSLISLLTIISCDTSICMDDVFVDHFLSFFVYFSTRQLWYFFFLWLQMRRLLTRRGVFSVPFFPSLSHIHRYGIFRNASVRCCCFYPSTGEIFLIYRWVLFRLSLTEKTLLCSCSMEISFVFQTISLFQKLQPSLPGSPHLKNKFRTR